MDLALRKDTVFAGAFPCSSMSSTDNSIFREFDHGSQCPGPFVVIIRSLSSQEFGKLLRRPPTQGLIALGGLVWQEGGDDVEISKSLCTGTYSYLHWLTMTPSTTLGTPLTPELLR